MKSLFNSIFVLLALVFVSSCNDEENITKTTKPESIKLENYGKLGKRSTNQKLLSITNLDENSTYNLEYDHLDRVTRLYSQDQSEEYKIDYSSDSIVVLSYDNNLLYQRELFTINNLLITKVEMFNLDSNNLFKKTFETEVQYTVDNKLSKFIVKIDDLMGGTEVIEQKIASSSSEFKTYDSGFYDVKFQFDLNSERVVTFNTLLAGLVNQSPWLSIFLANNQFINDKLPSSFTFLGVESDVVNVYTDKTIKSSTSLLGDNINLLYTFE